jgi:hypothetical protein
LLQTKTFLSIQDLHDELSSLTFPWQHTMKLVLAACALVAGVSVLMRTNVYNGAKLAWASRHQLSFVQPSLVSYVTVKHVEAYIIKAMLNSQGGVHLLAMPQSTGKTTTALVVAQQLLAANHVSGVVYVDASISSTTSAPNFAAIIEDAMRLPRGSMYPSFSFAHRFLMWWLTPGELMSQRIVVIVDNVDHSHLSGSHRSGLVSIATQSFRTQDFVVLMLCRQAAVAKEISSWNGKAKIFLRQNSSAMRSIKSEIVQAVFNQRLNLTAEKTAEFVRLAEIAESVGFVYLVAGFLRGGVHALDKYELLAQAYQSNWQQLSSQLEQPA